MKPYQLHHGDCLEVLATMADNSVDAVVTDPPYGLSFMGKNWDHGVPGEAFWREALRVAKPGAHLLAFGGTRTFHRLAVAIEDAGWEIRDTVIWCYGSGFPKSLDVSKAIDRAAGAERKVISEKKTNSGGMAHISKTNAEHGYRPAAYNGHSLDDTAKNCIQVTAPATPEAQQWQGWGTALKPAWEPVIVARKPLKGTVAANVLKYGTGAINVDGCRVEHNGRRSPNAGDGTVHRTTVNTYGKATSGDTFDVNQHRWPANVIHDGSDEVIELFPNSGKGNGGKPYNYKGKEYNNKDTSMFNGDKPNAPSNFNDSGSAARYFKACPDDDLEDREIRRLFYCAKASKRDRNEGLEGFGVEPAVLRTQLKISVNARRNNHVTVKPTALMRYLCRLVTPPGGIVLDPFMGSGSTGKAAMLEGFQFIGIEREDEYVKIAQARIEYAIATKESQDTLTETTTSDPRQLSIDDI